MAAAAADIQAAVQCIARAADDVPSKLSDRRRAQQRADDVLHGAQELVRTLQTAPDNSAHREQVTALARTIRQGALQVGEQMDDGRRTEEQAAEVARKARALVALVDSTGTASFRRSREILGAVRRLGDVARALQPKLAEGKRYKSLEGLVDAYYTLLDVLGIMCEDRLERDEQCQALHTAAMTAHLEAVAAAADQNAEPMHRAAPGGKRKLATKTRGRAAGEDAAPASRKRGASRDVPARKQPIATMRITVTQDDDEDEDSEPESPLIVRHPSIKREPESSEDDGPVSPVILRRVKSEPVDSDQEPVSPLVMRQVGRAANY